MLDKALARPQASRSAALVWLLAFGLLLAACAQRGERPEGGDFALGFALIENVAGGETRFRAALTLENRGAATLGAGGWALYFNFLPLPDPESLDPGVRFERVNGDLRRLAPTPEFAPLGPGESRRLGFTAPGWLIKESAAPAGAYFVFAEEGGEPRVEAVGETTVAPIAPDRVRRTAVDRVPVPTAAGRYAANAALGPPPREPVPIVPAPREWVRGDGHLELTGPVNVAAIEHPHELAREAALVAEALAPWASTATGASPPPIRLRLAETHEGVGVEDQEGADDRRSEGGGTSSGSTSSGRSEKGGTSSAGTSSGSTSSGSTSADSGAPRGSESYRLTIDAQRGIEIVGGGTAGVFYAIQSLRALLPPRPPSADGEPLRLREVRIDDAPRFGYRGLHLDVARSFHSVETVKKLLDLAAFYKLNRFHFHLTDDEGWRFAVRALPELTEIGARRGHTASGLDHLPPSFGSGPEPGVAPGSGHYTRSQLVEILRHATARHIEVVPEIDVPGHARAAIVSMAARAERLAAAGRAGEAGEYLLTDPGDRSQYRSVQGWSDNVVDPCLPSTYRFLETVVDEVVALWAEAGAPLTVIHTGGDEVPAGVWERSPACARLIAESDELRSTAALPGYFRQRLTALLAARGLVMAGWEEIALAAEGAGEGAAKRPAVERVGDGLRPYVWNNVWGWGAEDLGYRLANAGFDVVLANATNLYFDLAYDKDPREPGYAWAGFVDTRAVWELLPFDLYSNANADLMGNPLAPGYLASLPRLTERGRASILGIQGQLWGENAGDRSRLERMAFPKLLGLAERAWAPPPEWEKLPAGPERERARDAAWSEFAHRLGGRELPRLDHLAGGVDYRLPPPGARLEGGRLAANTAFPGLEIRYTLDGSEPTAGSPLYREPVAVAAGVVRLRTFDGRGRGSLTTVVER